MHRLGSSAYSYLKEDLSLLSSRGTSIHTAAGGRGGGGGGGGSPIQLHQGQHCSVLESEAEALPGCPLALRKSQKL